MINSRSYADACGAAHGLELVGERWALLVVRELLLGPKRFTDLRADLPGISTNVLTTRLDQLVAAGVVARRRLPPPAASAVYELTDWGRELEPVISALGRWAARSPNHDVTAHLSVTSLVLSLRTNFAPAAAACVDVTIQLRLGDDTFTAAVRDGQLHVDRMATTATTITMPTNDPDATLTGSPAAIAGLVYGPLPVDEAALATGITITGDLAAVQRFAGVFALPEPATS